MIRRPPIGRRGVALPPAALAACAALAALAGCGSPEAERVAGGGAGADPGNRDALVEMHRGAAMYAGTPCVTTLPDCDGPLPLSGRTADEEDR